MKFFVYLFNILSLFNFGSNFKQEIVTKTTEQVENVISVNESSYVTIVENNSYLYYENLEYALEGFIINKSLDTLNNIYLVCNNAFDVEIIIFNKFNKKITCQSFNDVYVENLYDINNTLYLVGSLNNQGLIYHLTYELKIINERIFNGDGFIRVNHLISYNDNYYITIYKDGITNNSEFINHGNDVEIKSLIVKLDLDFQIANIYYINENRNSEIIRNIYLQNNNLKFLLKTNEEYFVYNMSLNLDNVKYYKINSKDDLELFSHFKKINKELLFNKTLKKIMLANNEELIDIYQLSNLEILFDYKIVNGNLYIYGFYNELVVYKIIEYEIIKKDDKVLNYFNLNYLDTSNIIVESWFGDIKTTVDVITPYFDKAVNGIYKIEYSIFLENQKLETFCVDLLVEDYTNFYNNGIYNVNKTLEFFGTATLNGIPIYYGMPITEPGEYDIEITNVNGEKQLYHIYIVENYYKEEKIINTNTIDVIDNKVTIELNYNNLVIKEVIVNDTSYSNYKVIDDTLIIEFNKNHDNVESNILNGIIFLNNDEEIYYDINEQFTFNYLKSPPNIVLNKTLESNSININTVINDFDKTFNCLKAIYDSKKEIIYDEKSITTNKIKLYYLYDLGNGDIKEILICEIIQDKLFNINLDISYESGSINSFDITMSVDRDSLEVLKVNDVSMLDFYKKIEHTNYLRSIIILSFSLFFIIVGVFICYIIIKKRKQKTF